MDPGSLRVLCLACALPDEDEREGVITEAIREQMVSFEKQHGRRPESVQEFTAWVTDND